MRCQEPGVGPLPFPLPCQLASGRDGLWPRGTCRRTISTAWLLSISQISCTRSCAHFFHVHSSSPTPTPVVMQRLPQAARALNSTKSHLGNDFCCKTYANAIAQLVVARLTPSLETQLDAKAMPTWWLKKHDNKVQWSDLICTNILHNHPDALVSNWIY
jgi:hypothetical protein